MKKIGILLLYVCLAFKGTAQERLTLQQAIGIALENNYDIHIIAKDLQVADNNVDIGNAGMLPTVSGDLSSNSTIQNSTQTQASGDIRTVKNGKRDRKSVV